MNAELKFEPTSLVTEGKAMTGVVYLQADSAAFPGNRWTDFAAPVITQCLNVLEGMSESQSICFFDGPFSLEVSGDHEGRLRLTFLHSEAKVGEADADLKLFLSASLQAAREILVAVEKLQWSHPDVLELERALARAERFSSCA